MQSGKMAAVVLHVREPEPAFSFYRDVLALSPVRAEGPWHELATRDGHLVALRVVEGFVPTGAGAGLCLQVEDLAPWRERLARLGVPVLEEVSAAYGAWLLVSDPLGNPVYLFSSNSASSTR